MRLSLAIAALCGLLASGCGGDDGGGDDQPVDGGPSDSSSGDAPTIDCYREQDDTGNAATGEPTGLLFGVGEVAICGTIAADHPSADVLDVDRYVVTVSSGGPSMLRVSAPAAGGLDRVEVVIESATGIISRARVIGGVGAALVALPVGAHTVAITATGATGAPIGYRLYLLPDDPLARCPMSAATPEFVERDESAAGHRGNDTVAVQIAPLRTALTAITTDAPEPTSLAISAGARTSVTGLSADVPSAGDAYRDRDTFAVYTGQTTNVLELRASWASAADLDLLVFEADRAGDPLGWPVSTVTGELAVTAVKPGTLYWIWVGGANRSNGLPASYRLSVCGQELPVAL